MSSKSGSLTAVVSLVTAISTVVLSFPAFAQVQTNSGQTNSGAVAAPLGSVITVTPDGKTIVTPPAGASQQGNGTSNNTGNTGSSGSRTTSTGITGVTTGTPTTGVTPGTSPTGVTQGTPSTGVGLDTPGTGVKPSTTGTAPAAITPGSTTGR